jgi:hypothetical protein
MHAVDWRFVLHALHTIMRRMTVMLHKQKIRYFKKGLKKLN